jgi:hypothetical protein
MAAASRSLATTLQGARFASGLLQPSYTTYRDTTRDCRGASLYRPIMSVGISPDRSVCVGSHEAAYMGHDDIYE